MNKGKKGTGSMRYYNKLEDIIQEKNTVITLGKFDGIHRGHQKLLNEVHRLSHEKDLQTVLFTFDVSPQTRIGKRDYCVIVTNSEKKELVEKFGIDIMIECPFTDQVRNMEAEAFVEDILVNRLKAKALVIGDDFGFGKGRKGTPEFLKAGEKKYGYTVDIIEKEKDGDRDISSTYVREELIKGDIEKANELLGYRFFVEGEIIHGMHIGTGLGFPTINIVPDKEKILPPNGVYATITEVEGREYHSITNIGVKPTVDGKTLGVETFIYDFEGSLYGKKAYIKLLKFIRNEKKFASIDELKKQVDKDIEFGRNLK